MSRALTATQLDALDCIRLYGECGGGWAEIDLQLASRRGWPQYLEAATAKRVYDALCRRGFIGSTDDWPCLTEAGRSALGGRT